MSLNKFTNVDIGQEIDLAIGCDVIEANSLSVGAIAVDDIAPIPPATKIDIEGDLDMKDNKILNTTEITSTTQVSMPQPLDMVGNSINGVAEVRGFSGNPLPLTTFADGTGINIQENGTIQAQKDVDILDNKMLNVNKISNDAQGLVVIAGESGETDLSVSVDEIRAIPPVITQAYLQSEGNGKVSIIDNDFNTLDASSGFNCNVNTGGTHSFTINNAQKFDIEPFETVSRSTLKMLNKPLLFDISANIQTTNTQNLNIDLDGEFLDIKSDTAVDNALEFTTSMGNFSFNRNVKAPSIEALTGDLTVNSNLDMNSNNIVNVPLVRGDGDLLLETAEATGSGIGIEEGGDITVYQETTFNGNGVRGVANLAVDSINTNIVYVRTAADLPTAIGGFHNLEANIGYVIVGSVTLTNGIRFNINNAIQGADFNSVLIFDETANDIIGFQAVDNNVYISNLTVQGGGGHFAGGVVGLFDCVDIDTGGAPPFYGRNKRFKVDGVNIIASYKLGRVQGYGTLNFNNNFLNGGGGAPTGVYTVDGLKVSDGLSLEFNNNKVVLFAGAQIASTAIMLEFTPNLAPSNAGFNAVAISGNIFHPRGTERGIVFNDGSTTQLGVISANTFIRTGGTEPLIDYPNQSTFDNYNPECIETYTVDSNVGVTNSEPNVKAHFVNSQNISSTAYTDIPLVQNLDFSPQKQTARFGVEMLITGMGALDPDFIDFETITQIPSGRTALILKAEPRAPLATEQIVYICDMTASFDGTAIRNQAGTTTSTGCEIRPTFCYGEKDPRKLNLVCNLTLDGTGNQVFNASPALDTGSGFVTDTVCESRTFANATGLGGTFTIACQNVYSEGDKVKIQVKADTGGNFNVLNYVLTIK